MKITLFQIESRTIILISLGILTLIFSIIAYRVLKRKRQRLNIITSGFYISLSIGFILNMIYAMLSNNDLIKILNFLTNFFFFFGGIFLFIANMIILESTLIYSAKRQNRYVLLYALILGIGMFILVLLGIGLNNPILGVGIVEVDGAAIPKWGLVFFTYVVSIMTGFTIIPTIYTNFKIYFKFETKSLKRKWLCYLVGFIGLSAIFYLVSVYNLLDPVEFRIFRTIISVSILSVILWGYLIYYGIGTKLKK